MHAVSGDEALVISDKLREAVHYVCRRMASEPEKLGAVKLQKILWYLDVRSYGVTGKPVTGAVYVKGNYGPYTRDVEPVVRELVAARRLHTDTVEFYDKDKAAFIGKGETDKSVFSERELYWLEEITRDICETHTAASISEKSHGPIWKMAQYGEEIPFTATVVRVRPATKEGTEAIKKELGLVT